MLTKRYAVAAVVAISAYYVMADGGGHGHVPHADPHAHAPVHHEPAVSYSEPQYYSRKCSLIDIMGGNLGAESIDPLCDSTFKLALQVEQVATPISIPPVRRSSLACEESSVLVQWA